MYRFLILFLLTIACGGRTTHQTPDAQPDPSDQAATATPAPIAEVKKPDGAACLSADECTSGICEGEGCGDDTPGVCAPESRACTRDLKPYCGCDGDVFRASGGCPGQRFEKRGTCEAGDDGAEAPVPAPAEAKQAGERCLVASECASGVCEGEGCGDDTPGVCAPEQRACTRDLKPYCGCDGETFRTSGSCPGKRFERRGFCEP
jgi:hypothetical protein